MKTFVAQLEEHLILAGIKILPVFENGEIVKSLQCYCTYDTSALEFAEYLKTKIKNNQIQFMPLILSKSFQEVSLHRKGDVLIRYNESFFPGGDTIIRIYDVLLRL